MYLHVPLEVGHGVHVEEVGNLSYSDGLLNKDLHVCVLKSMHGQGWQLNPLCVVQASLPASLQMQCKVSRC